MQYLSLDSIVKNNQRPQVLPNNSQSNRAHEKNDPNIKDLASNLQKEISTNRSVNENILAQLIKNQNRQSSALEMQVIQKLRNSLKKLGFQTIPDSDELADLEAEYQDFLDQNSIKEKPYLKSFVNQMDSHISNLRAKNLSSGGFTVNEKEYIFNIEEIAFNVLDVVINLGMEFKVQDLYPEECLKTSKFLGKMRSKLASFARKNFPGSGSDLQNIDTEVLLSYNPDKVYSGFDLVSVTTEISKKMTAITKASINNKFDEANSLRIEMKDHVNKTYKLYSQLDEDLKNNLP